MRGLKEKVIIVAGVTSGIGEGIARRLSEEGAKLVVAGRSIESCKSIAEDICNSGGSATAMYYDQGDEALIASLIADTIEHYGRLDGLVCNAAELRKEVVQHDVDIGHMSPDLWERLFKINVIGYALLVREAIPHLIAAGGGGIVLISSEAAKMARNTRHCYSVTKAGVEAMVRQISETWGQQGVRCNAIAPGMILTEKATRDISEELLNQMKSRVRSKRLGKPSDIASLTGFLLSDDGEWLQGQVISVNGGSLYRD